MEGEEVATANPNMLHSSEMFDLKVLVTLTPELLDVVAERGSHPSPVISRDLQRYYAALAAARAVLRDQLFPAEIGLILDSLQGKPMDDSGYVRLLWAEIESDIRLGRLDETWQVDGAHLIETLSGLSLIERCALADAAERWWNRLAKGERPDLSEVLA